MNFCPNCGAKITDNDKFCPSCGYNLNSTEPHTDSSNDSININVQPTDHISTNPAVTNIKKHYSDGCKITIKIFLILSCVGCGLLFIIYLINALTAGYYIGGTGSFAAINIFYIVASVFSLVPLAWTIPLTLHIWKKLKNDEKISVAVSVCTLIFVSLVAGIILLACDDAAN